MKRKIFVLLLSFLWILAACTPVRGSVTIEGEDSYILEVGVTLQLTAVSEHLDGDIVWNTDGDCVEVSGTGLVTARRQGAAKVMASIGTASDSVEITVREPQKVSPKKIVLTAERYELTVGERLLLSAEYVTDEGTEQGEFTYEIVGGEECASVLENTLIGIAAGNVSVVATDGTLCSEHVSFTVSSPHVLERTVLLTCDKQTIGVGESATLTALCFEDGAAVGNAAAVYQILEGTKFASLEGNILTGLAAGTVKIIASYGGAESDVLTVTVEDTAEELELRAEKYSLVVGESTTLYLEGRDLDSITFEAVRGASYTELDGNRVTGRSAGGATAFVARHGETVSNEIEIEVLSAGVPPTNITLSADKKTPQVGEKVVLSYTLTPSSAAGNISYHFLEGEAYAEIVGNEVTVTAVHPVTIVGTIGDVLSNTITLNAAEPATDPYMNVSQSTFYASYTPADSAKDAYFRTRHDLMSGDISEQDQAPTLALNRPTLDGVYLRNSNALYSEDGDTYYVLGSDGEVANRIYRDGAYVTLEEVAAYVMAFGAVPANYTEEKSGKPKTDPWGKYLRLNHSYFSGDTSQYPYEPHFPDIKGGGGTLSYYEIDIGTTGTDCDPNYDIRPYNDGSKITRGAARIIYTRYGADGREIEDVNDKYLFYTYNHYNDFREYLNYEGGWGEMFGNITGGGTLSSKYDYAPTPYIPTLKRPFFVL